MTVVAVLQARMRSTRLPGKVLMDVAGEPMLVHELRRLARCRAVDEIVVATSENAADDPVAQTAAAAGVRTYRGSEHDVLDRYVGAARETTADAVVRVTADCPLLDPDVVDTVVGALDPLCDYASNVVERTYPTGLDVEALHRDTLERVARLATSAPAREHVTWFVYAERPDLFELRSVVAEQDDSDLRWTVDEASDLALVRRLYDELELARVPPYRDVVAHVRAHPELAHVS